MRRHLPSFIFFRRCRKHFFHAPPGSKSVVKCWLSYAKLFAPICKAKRFSFIGKQPNVSSIIRLGYLIGPPTVIRSISLAVINSVKSQAIRAFSHVSKERRIFRPPITNLNSFTNVVLGVFLGISPASPVHAKPLVIGTGAMASLGMAMGRNSAEIVHVVILSNCDTNA